METTGWEMRKVRERVCAEGWREGGGGMWVGGLVVVSVGKGEELRLCLCQEGGNG